MRVAQLAEGVTFNQDDVRAVQLAKSAIRTGVELLLREAGLQAGRIDRFIVAGAFGAYLDVQSGIGIGLFPPLPAGALRAGRQRRGRRRAADAGLGPGARRSRRTRARAAAMSSSAPRPGSRRRFCSTSASDDKRNTP